MEEQTSIQQNSITYRKQHKAIAKTTHHRKAGGKTRQSRILYDNY
jgi:hypothetical protein